MTENDDKQKADLAADLAYKELSNMSEEEVTMFRDYNAMMATLDVSGLSSFKMGFADSILAAKRVARELT